MCQSGLASLQIYVNVYTHMYLSLLRCKFVYKCVSVTDCDIIEFLCGGGVSVFLCVCEGRRACNTSNKKEKPALINSRGQNR